MPDLVSRIADLERQIKGIPSRWGRTMPVPIRIGRGNTVYTSATAYKIYGALGSQNPTSVSAGMWNAGTKQWIPADSTWDAGICYGYLKGGSVVAVAQRFNGISGAIAAAYSLTEGAVVYSRSQTSYVLGADTLTIYLVDHF